MKTLLAILASLIVLAITAIAQTTTTDCDTSATINGDYVKGSTRCTSTDDSAERAAQAKRQADQDKAWQDFGTNLGNMIAQNRIKKDIKKYCEQHQGEPWNWQVNGQNLSGTCPGDISQSAGLKQYCNAHPGEFWAKKTPAGVIQNSGTCPGEISQSAAQKWLIDSFRKTITESGSVGFAEIVGNKIIAHDERASAVRLHMTVQSPDFLEKARQAGLATFVYTNDADVNLTYDVKSSPIPTAPTEPVEQTAQSLKKIGNGAIDAEMCTTICPSGMVLTCTGEETICKYPSKTECTSYKDIAAQYPHTFRYCTPAEQASEAAGKH